MKLTVYGVGRQISLPALYKFPHLPAVGSGEAYTKYGEWGWHRMDELHEAIQLKLKNQGFNISRIKQDGFPVPHYESFDPEFLSNARFTAFSWLYHLHGASIADFHLNEDITQCGFYTGNMDFLFVPAGWTTEVLKFIDRKIIRLEKESDGYMGWQWSNDDKVTSLLGPWTRLPE